ncbi:hypothetical protein [Metallibacterium sp.]|uniref:plasmid mobilization protein n=1 Tax=Metallibacterium sp. TaxID=2940281 RepID=UPI0026052E1E|nr:hypothetical protein [Metallibacterium sp.]
MTMRRRVLSIRLSDQEYQSLKQQAEQAGISVPVLARRLALDSVQLAPRLEAIEHLIRAVPDRTVLLEAFQRLASKIDRAAASKGVQP